MKQYLDLLRTIKEKGTYKPPAREGMPGTQSLFGYQLRHNLAEGFPLLTTKKIYWKAIVLELLWFLRGDTNIKYLVDNGVNIWNEDAYNYYLKKYKEHEYPEGRQANFEGFITSIQVGDLGKWFKGDSYKLGDCGYQYGKVWRKWGIWTEDYGITINGKNTKGSIDQIKNVITSLRENPESRRHIVTAIDPAHDKDLALYWCHAMFQFNCRPLTYEERVNLSRKKELNLHPVQNADSISLNFLRLEQESIPKYYLDCQLYQRSCDVVLGVPFNIASYALLTHIIAKLCNMIPGEFIHTFGDVHIYDNHKDAVEEQLSRSPSELPTLKLPYIICEDLGYFGETLQCLDFTDFKLENYNPQSTIKAELSTGLLKKK